MSWKISIIQVKPNPAGKDKAGQSPKAEQLLGEWVDLKNVGDGAVTLATLNLSHTVFGPGCTPRTDVHRYWRGPSDVSLQPGQIVRVHTGRSLDASLMKAEDRNGVHQHAYAESGTFVLNNVCGDSLYVHWLYEGKWQQEDRASYGPNPPEGAVLVRVGDRLVASVVSAVAWR